MRQPRNMPSSCGRLGLRGSDAMRVEEMRLLWREVSFPILYNPGKGKPLLLRLSPPEKRPQLQPTDEYEFLVEPNKHRPKWGILKRHWELPHSWLDDLVKKIVGARRALYLTQHIRSYETCSKQCQEAKGFDCECSCMGARHGENNLHSGWFEISEYFAVKSGEEQLACRLIVSTSN